MTREETARRVECALENHRKGYNCAQSVICAFADKTDLDEQLLFRLTEGMGLGMGGMEGTCGAIAAAAVLSGLKGSTGNLEAPDSKGRTYKDSRACLAAFKEKNGSVICRDLKGVETGRVLRSCDDCIADAVEIIAGKFYEEN